MYTGIEPDSVYVFKSAKQPVRLTFICDSGAKYTVCVCLCYMCAVCSVCVCVFAACSVCVCVCVLDECAVS